MSATDVAAAPTSAPPARTGLLRQQFGGWMVILALVAGLAAGLLTGYAVATLTQRGGPDAPGDTSAEAGFARDMINHHAQAVAMGLIAYDRAELEGVRQLGYDIATAQQSEMGMMRQWLRAWDLLPTGAEPPMAWMPDGAAVEPGELMPGMATQEQMQQLREAEGSEVDRLFLVLMITHHLGGVHMADGVLELSDHPDVTRAATLMKSNQQTEIEVLRGLQDRLPEAD